jgi:hypothetical protein
MKRDLKDNIATVLLRAPADAVHADVASNILDTADCFGVEVDAVIGALTGGGAESYVTPVLQESDTTADADFSAVDSSEILGVFSAEQAGGTIQRAGYIGHKRYVRIKFTYTGTGITAGIVGAVGVLGIAKERPVTAPSPVTAT